MPRKKESILEKAKEIAEEAVEKVVEEAKEVAKEVKEEIKEVAEEAKEIVESISPPAKKPKKSKLEELKEKAKKLEGVVEEEKSIDLRKKIKGEDDYTTDKKDLLVPLEDYLKSSIHLGTRVITPDVKPFVYRRRADGLAIFDTSIQDEKIKEVAKYISKFSPEQMIIVCKREAGWPAVEKFSQLFGIRAFTKKYPAGILTNTNLENFMETDLAIICDPWLDKNAVSDAKNVKIPIVAICDTNNYTNNIDVVLPANNKSHKSIGMILYLITKLYIHERKLDISLPPIEEFIPDWNNLQDSQ
jgi:small subunit ribosomal protein S2